MKFMCRTINGKFWRYWLTASLFFVSLGTSVFLIAHVYAAGIPAANALSYTGYLETPDGVAVEGNKAIMLEVFDAEIEGNKLCEVIQDETELTAGRFQIPLPDECTEAVKANPDLWLAVRVDGALIGRTKLGAVPYAVEAGHSTLADIADHAENATQADKARLASEAQAAAEGTFTVPGDLIVMGNATITNTLSIGFRKISGEECTFTGSATECTCAPGERPIGGAVLATSGTGNGFIVESRDVPGDDWSWRTWRFVCKDDSNTIRQCAVANAFCARFEN